MGFSDILDLLEHLPKVGSLLARLVPVLENYIPNNQPPSPSTTKLDSESRAAMNALRDKVEQATAAHAIAFRQMNEQSERIAEAATDARAAKFAAEAVESRATAIEKKLSVITTLLGVTFAAVLVAIVLLAVLLVHH